MVLTVPFRKYYHVHRQRPYGHAALGFSPLEMEVAVQEFCVAAMREAARTAQGAGETETVAAG